MFLHVLGDTAGTLVVVAGGGLVWGMNGGVYVIVDPICTLVFACLICASTYPFLVELVWVLLESAPKGWDAAEVARTLSREVPGVVGVHCLHVWQLTPSEVCLTAHLHVDTTSQHPHPSSADTMRTRNAGGAASGGVLGGGGGRTGTGTGMGFALGSETAATLHPEPTSASQRQKTQNPVTCEDVLKKATRVCTRRFGINHVTLQVTAVACRGGLPSCGDFVADT